MYVGIQTDRRISDVDDGGIVIWLRDSGVVGTGRYRRHEALHTQPLSLSLLFSLSLPLFHSLFLSLAPPPCLTFFSHYSFLGETTALHCCRLVVVRSSRTPGAAGLPEQQDPRSSRTPGAAGLQEQQDSRSSRTPGAAGLQEHPLHITLSARAYLRSQ